MSRLGVSRWFGRWKRWAVVEAVELYWDCRCAYHNAATYRCYFCGSRRPRIRVADEAVLAHVAGPPAPAEGEMVPAASP